MIGFQLDLQEEIDTLVQIFLRGTTREDFDGYRRQYLRQLANLTQTLNREEVETLERLIIERTWEESLNPTAENTLKTIFISIEIFHYLGC